MIEMAVESVRRNMQTKQRFATLHVASEQTEEMTFQRFLYVPVDDTEAYAIAIALQTPSPQPQDIHQIIDGKDAQLTSIVIVYLGDNHFSAQTILDVEGKQLKVDTSPGNALAAALHAKVPILIEEGVFELLRTK